tara:strand:+ start:139 stop:309 length:171 start_codon:yes stop_codon:yes gene_type:complete
MGDTLYNSIMDLDADTLNDIFDDVSPPTEEELKAYADFMYHHERRATLLVLEELPF